MLPEHDSMPEQRHHDLQELSAKFSLMVSEHQTVKRTAIFLAGAITVVIIPLLFRGVAAVSASVRKQEVMVDQFTEFKTDFNQFQSEQRHYNERTSEMWYRGGYGSKKETSKE